MLAEGQHEGHASLSAIEQERNEWSRTRACLLKEIEDLRGSVGKPLLRAFLGYLSQLYLGHSSFRMGF